jgi:ribosome maturation factor RimP
MDNIIKKLEDLIRPEMEKMDIKLDSITWINEKNNYTLRVILDKVNGIDLDTIVDATNVINPILDENDLIEEQYTLEVSSKERGSEQNEW